MKSVVTHHEVYKSEFVTDKEVLASASEFFDNLFSFTGKSSPLNENCGHPEPSENLWLPHDLSVPNQSGGACFEFGRGEGGLA